LASPCACDLRRAEAGTAAAGATTTTAPWMPPPPPDRRDYLYREGRRHDGGEGDPLLPPAPTPPRWRDSPYHPSPPPPLRDHARPSPRQAPTSASSGRPAPRESSDLRPPPARRPPSGAPNFFQPLCYFRRLLPTGRRRVRPLLP
jgi:hypothetical protein